MTKGSQPKVSLKPYFWTQDWLVVLILTLTVVETEIDVVVPMTIMFIPSVVYRLYIVCFGRRIRTFNDSLQQSGQ